MNGKLKDSSDTRMRALAAPIAVAIASLTMPWQTHAAADCATSTCDICVESDETRTVTGSEAANCIDVESGGLLLIDPADGNASLALGSGASALTSTIDGDVLLIDDTDGYNSAVLSVVTVNHTVTGSGKITGQDDLAEIIVASGVTLTNNVNILGHFQLEGAGNFINDKCVSADAPNGTIDIALTGTIDDTDGACWKVIESGAMLRFVEEPDYLDGDFTVANGTLRAGSDPPRGDDINICTSGSLTHTGGSIVAGNGDSFCFHCSCP